MKVSLMILIIWAVAIPAGFAQIKTDSTIADKGQLELKTDTAKINYSVGYQIGGDFKRQGVNMDAQALVKGIQDALKSIDPLMSEQQMRTTLIDLKKKIVALQQEEKKKTEIQYRDEGLKFLKANAQKADITTLPSGLQYKVLQSGKGKKPGNTDTVEVHYKGTLVDGAEFDSSLDEKEPVRFRVDSVIAGWTEALQLMREGDKWKLFLPPELGYGERGPLAHRTLIFDVELVKVN